MPCFGCRPGLSNRAPAHQDQVQLGGHSIYGDIDEEIGGLIVKVDQLKNVSFISLWVQLHTEIDALRCVYQALHAWLQTKQCQL